MTDSALDHLNRIRALTGSGAGRSYNDAEAARVCVNQARERLEAITADFHKTPEDKLSRAEIIDHAVAALAALGQDTP